MSEEISILREYLSKDEDKLRMAWVVYQNFPIILNEFRQQVFDHLKRQLAERYTVEGSLTDDRCGEIDVFRPAWCDALGRPLLSVSISAERANVGLLILGIAKRSETLPFDGKASDLPPGTPFHEVYLAARTWIESSQVLKSNETSPKFLAYGKYAPPYDSLNLNNDEMVKLLLTGSGRAQVVQRYVDSVGGLLAATEKQIDQVLASSAET